MIPPKRNAEFVACMEDVLDLYQQPCDPEIPLVNMDEQPVQLTKETRLPIPASPGKPERIDYEYERNGTASIFIFVQALRCWRRATVRRQHTSKDWAQEIKHLLEIDYPDARKVRLICDNLSTHKIAALYEAFAPEEARRLAERLEIHYTPKHGSWLNIAECELSALTRQCLDRRIPDMETLMTELQAWEASRNSQQRGIKWQFTTRDARTRLRRLYPEIQ